MATAEVPNNTNHGTPKPTVIILLTLYLKNITHVIEERTHLSDISLHINGFSTTWHGVMLSRLHVYSSLEVENLVLFPSWELVRRVYSVEPNYSTQVCTQGEHSVLDAATGLALQADFF